jgi:hypothetical protein
MAEDSTEIYILMKDDKPIIAHTTLQGAAMEQATAETAEQKKMYVATVWLKDDNDS